MKETNNEEQLGIFIEGYLSARFDMLIDDELTAHLALVSETAQQEDLDAAVDEFYNNDAIFDSAVAKANAEMEILYDTLVQFAVESWTSREKVMSEREPLLPSLRQGGQVGEA